MQQGPIEQVFLKSPPLRKKCLTNFRRRVYLILSCGILAQLGEHLPYKQRVIGSSPIGPTFLPAIAGFLIFIKNSEILRNHAIVFLENCVKIGHVHTTF